MALDARNIYQPLELPRKYRIFFCKIVEAVLLSYHAAFQKERHQMPRHEAVFTLKWKNVIFQKMLGWTKTNLLHSLNSSGDFATPKVTQKRCRTFLKHFSAKILEMISKHFWANTMSKTASCTRI